MLTVNDLMTENPKIKELYKEAKDKCFDKQFDLNGVEYWFRVTFPKKLEEILKSYKEEEVNMKIRDEITDDFRRMLFPDYYE